MTSTTRTTRITRTTRRCRARRAAAAVAAAATAALVLTACGSDNSSSGQAGHDMSAMGGTPSSSATGSASASASGSQSAHNAQDVAFAQQMIPHHQQAIAMAELAPSRAQSQDVKTLAAQIKQAQDPEITLMSGWLTAWGEAVPSAGTSSSDGMSGMSGMSGTAGSTSATSSTSSMPGEMSDADMTKLAGLSGAAFDTAFLQMMVSHHEGAVQMAKAEQAKGSYGPAKQLAASIVTSQTAQIATMNHLLAS
jgi:uncharacterized protein (DUF305 family)